MHTPRLLFLPLLIALSVATAASQSSTDKSSFLSQVAPSQRAQASRNLFPLPLHFDGDGSLVSSAPGSGELHNLTEGQDDVTCYKIRAYRVVRENPESDVTTFAGYSTCQRSAQFQLRTAVDSSDAPSR